MFNIIDRPARNRRKISDKNMTWDEDIEDALRTTLDSGRAVELPLSRFHSSPAKGRLWKEKLAVRHRVLADRQNVAAWLEEV